MVDQTDGRDCVRLGESPSSFQKARDEPGVTGRGPLWGAHPPKWHRAWDGNSSKKEPSQEGSGARMGRRRSKEHRK